MDNTIRRLVAAGAVAGFLTVGGMSLASAQDDPTTTTEEETTTTVEDSTTDDSATTEDSADEAARDEEDCPKDGADADTSDDAETGS